MSDSKNKDEYFEIGSYLMNMLDFERLNFIELTSLLNREKGIVLTFQKS